MQAGKSIQRGYGSSSNVSLNWIFVHDDESTPPEARVLSQSQFSGLSQDCIEIFVPFIQKHYFNPDVDTIKFYMSKDRISTTAPDEEGWEEIIKKEIFKTSFKQIAPAISLLQSLNPDVVRDKTLIHLVVTAEPMTTINWYFFYRGDDSSPKPVRVSSVISHARLNAPMETLKEYFATLLYNQRGINAYPPSLMFYQPKKPTPGDEKISPEFEDHYLEILSSLTLSDTLQRDLNYANLIHLVITANPLHAEQRDTVSELPVFRHESLGSLESRYEKLMGTRGMSPSEGSKSTNYITVQKSAGQMIYDGRQPTAGPAKLIAPTIQIFHPVFNKFLHILHGSKFQPSDRDLSLTQNVMCDLTKISEDENKRNEPIRESLSKLLDYPIVYQSVDRIKADGVSFFPENQPNCPILIAEFKREIGDGGSDPSTQVGITMRRYWRETPKSIRDKCCCPTFLLAGAGPWMCVLGAIITDKVIVQRLTDLYWMGLSTTEEDGRVYNSSRVFMALRESLKELRLFYKEVIPAKPQSSALNKKTVPSRFFPYPTSYITDNGQVVKFQYRCPLEDDNTCVTFQAIIVEGQDPTPDTLVVIKFVARYGEEAHRFLANAGHAPQLYYHGPISDASLYQGIEGPASEARPGLCLRREVMYMVVMAYVPSLLRFPTSARAQIKTILIKLHLEGFAFGDLRDPNILIDTNDRVQLIDFNWCGRFDMTIHEEGLPPEVEDSIRNIPSDKPHKGPFAVYPLAISQAIAWPEGVGALRPIRPSHDWKMFERLSF